MSKLDEIKEQAQNRIDNASAAGWIGGFEYRFFEDWLEKAIKDLMLELIDEEYDKMRMEGSDLVHWINARSLRRRVEEL